ncbi:MAG: hypothetical protein MUE53_05920 [Chitinophagales bacterium]|jgi:hypothetical protein|nr:hypothetical protein [Chitinophagales bacterium]
MRKLLIFTILFSSVHLAIAQYDIYDEPRKPEVFVPRVNVQSDLQNTQRQYPGQQFNNPSRSFDQFDEYDRDFSNNMHRLNRIQMLYGMNSFNSFRSFNGFYDPFFMDPFMNPYGFANTGFNMFAFGRMVAPGVHISMGHNPFMMNPWGWNSWNMWSPMNMCMGNPFQRMFMPVMVYQNPVFVTNSVNPFFVRPQANPSHIPQRPRSVISGSGRYNGMFQSNTTNVNQGSNSSGNVSVPSSSGNNSGAFRGSSNVNVSPSPNINTRSIGSGSNSGAGGLSSPSQGSSPGRGSFRMGRF